MLLQVSPRLSAATTIAAVLLVLAVVPSVANAATPAVAIDALNQQRLANGIPGGIVENRTWTSACAKHNGYMRANNLLVHDEQPGKLGYSSQGDWVGPQSVLAYKFGAAVNFPWTVNPWENAPYHLSQILQPGIRSVGYADDNKYVCMTTWPGVDNRRLSGIYTYPGNGRTRVPRSQKASEIPSTPQMSVGIAAAATTGPNILVFAHGLGGTSMRVRSASLFPPVRVKWVDNRTPRVGHMIPSGGILVPVRPLRANTTYTATVKVAGSARTRTFTWRFSTGAKLRPPLTARFVKGKGHSVRVSGRAAPGKVTITLRIKRRGAPTVKRVVRAKANGTYAATVTSSSAGSALLCATQVAQPKVCTTVRV